MSNLEKNKQIKQSLSDTRKRRETQECKVYELKIDKSSLSNNTLIKLNKLFLEAKWFYNYLLTQDIFNFDTKQKEILVMNKEKKLEERNINHLTSQMKQAIQQRAVSSIKSLSTKKKKGRFSEVGKLKFKSSVNSIPLKQYNNTYKLIDKNKIQIQGIRKKIRVNGVKQIPLEAEFANANLIKRNNDFYLKVTCFLPKQNQIVHKNEIGIDFGIKTQLTFSNGVKIESKIPVSSKSKKLYKKLSRSKKVNGLTSKTKNQYKIRVKLKKSYEETTNKKKDIKNKIIHKLKTDYSLVAVQNENIKGWHSGLFGKQVQESSIGGILSGIKKLPQTRIVSRFFPSTKLCTSCGTLNKIGLDERVYKCECGYEEDRDVHSARNILIESVPRESRELKPVENNTSSEILEYFKKIPNIKVSICSMKQEARVFRLG
jgi:transposase